MSAAMARYSDDDLHVVTRDNAISVIGYQTETSNAIEAESTPGESPIAQTAARFRDPAGFAAIPGAGEQPQVMAAYTDFTSLESDSPTYTYTMGLRMVTPTPSPEGLGIATIRPGCFLALRVEDATPESIPAAWYWVLERFADPSFPYTRSFTGDYEAYDPHPDDDGMAMTMFVAIVPPPDLTPMA